MSRLSYAVAGTLALLLTIPVAAHAAGNVLLPSTTSDSSAMPSLGLAPPPAAASSATTTPSSTAEAPATKTPVTAAQTPSGPTSAETQTAPSDASSALMAGSATAADMAKAMATPTPITVLDSPATIAQLPPGRIPTQVIRQPDMSGVYSEVYKGLPNGLTVGISPRSSYGSDDVEAISAKLGLSREQIPAACILTIRGLVQTNKGVYIVDGPAAPQVQIRYDGAITGMNLGAQAMCLTSRLPSGAGIINQIGDRFVIPLHGIGCPVPRQRVSQISVLYNGTDQSQCSF